MRGKIGYVVGLVALLSGCFHAATRGAVNSSVASTPRVNVASASVASHSSISTSPYAWCPTQVPGTRVKVQQMPNGAALEFDTTGDAGAVRERVDQMAIFHHQMVVANDPQLILERAAASATDDNLPRYLEDQVPKTNGMSQDQVRRATLESIAKVEATPNGARLILRAKSPWDIRVVRRFVKWRAAHMATNGCGPGDAEGRDSVT